MGIATLGVVKNMCEQCQRLTDNRAFIFETLHWRVFLASDQSYLGRCTVILKRHAGDLAELWEAEILDFISLVQRLERALRNAFDATMFNWTCLMNHAYRVSPPSPHVHWHFRPRYDHEVTFADVAFQDTEFGEHYDRMRTQCVPSDIAKQILQKIQKAL